MKLSSRPTGIWSISGFALSFFFDALNDLEKVGPDAVHLVDKGKPGNLVTVCLAPYRLRLGLNASYGAENAHGTVEYPKGSFNLYGEIHMARGVNDLNLGIVPQAGGDG